MRLLKRIALRIVIAGKVLGQLAWDSVAGYIRRNRLGWIVAGLGIGIGTTLVIAATHPDGAGHIMSRAFLVHWGWAALLMMLYSRLVILGERLYHRSRPAWIHVPWWAWYTIPAAAVVAGAAANEFLVGATRILDLSGAAAAGVPYSTWIRGDYILAEQGLLPALPGELPTPPAKSWSDIASWAFGSLTTAWYWYYCGDRLAAARYECLAWQDRRRRR